MLSGKYLISLYLGGVPNVEPKTNNPKTFLLRWIQAL